MDTTRHAGLGVLLAVASGGLALGLVTLIGGAPGENAAAQASPEENVRVADSVGDAHLLSAGRAPIKPQPVSSSTAQSPQAKAESPPASIVDEDRIRSAVADLGRLLDSKNFNRRDWASVTQAYADMLGESAIAVLKEVLGESNHSTSEVVAAGELFRILESRRGTQFSSLPQNAANRLRTACLEFREETDRSVTVAAARVLVGAGAVADSMQIADFLLYEEDSNCLENARWALSVNERPEIARHLVNGLEGLESGQRMVLVLRALGEMKAGDGGNLLSEPTQYRLTRNTSAFFRDGPSSNEMGSAILSALETVAPEAMRDVLFDCIDIAEPTLAKYSFERLVASGGDRVMARLGDRLLSESDGARAAFMTEAMVPAWGGEELAPSVRQIMLRTLETSALLSEDPAQRRRAVHCLGTLDEEACVEPLLKALTEDGDAHVRGAAATALGRLSDASKHRAVLRQIREFDPSPVVRRTAAVQLKQLKADAPQVRSTVGE